MELFEANTITGGAVAVRTPSTPSTRREALKMFAPPRSRSKITAQLPRKPDQPAVDAPSGVETIPLLEPLTLLEDENAVDANVPAPKKRKKAADDDEFEVPNLDVSRASSLNDSKYLEPEESKYKKAKTFEPSEEVAENLKDVTGLDESVRRMLITANPRLQVYLGLREYTPGGLRKTDLMEPIIKSVDLSNFAESQAYKENKSKDGKLSRLCKPFESASYYENQAELRGDVRTTKPYNREGLKEKPLEDLDAPATPAPDGVRRSKRAKNTRATEKMKDLQAMRDRDDEAYIFEDSVNDPPASPFFKNVKPLSKNYQKFSTKEAEQRKKAERAERARLRKEAKDLPPLSPIASIPNPQRSATPRPTTPPPLTPLLQQVAPSTPVANAPQRAAPRPKAKPKAKPKATAPVRTSGRARRPVTYQDAPSPVQTKKGASAAAETRSGRVTKPRK